MKNTLKIKKYNNATEVKLHNKRVSIGKVTKPFSEINDKHLFIEFTNYKKEGFTENTRVVFQNFNRNNTIINSGLFITKESAYALYIALQHELQLSNLENIKT